MCYMKKITHREMRNASGEILRRVAAGEAILITNHGQVAAIIGPPPVDALAQLIDQGQVRIPRRSISDLRKVVPHESSLTTTEILADVRGPW